METSHQNSGHIFEEQRFKPNWRFSEGSLARAACLPYCDRVFLPLPCPSPIYTDRAPTTTTIPTASAITPAVSQHVRRTCGDASPAARSCSAGLTDSEMPLSSSAAGSSLSESDPHVESHSSTVLGSLKRQLPSRFPIYTVMQELLRSIRVSGVHTEPTLHNQTRLSARRTAERLNGSTSGGVGGVGGISTSAPMMRLSV